MSERVVGYVRNGSPDASYSAIEIATPIVFQSRIVLSATPT
jgi:hypothetical protein